MSDNNKENKDTAQKTELRDEGLNNIMGDIPQRMLWLSAIATTAATIVVSLVGYLLVCR